MHNIFPNSRNVWMFFRGKCQRIRLFCEVYAKLWRFWCHFESSLGEEFVSKQEKAEQLVASVSRPQTRLLLRQKYDDDENGDDDENDDDDDDDEWGLCGQKRKKGFLPWETCHALWSCSVADHHWSSSQRWRSVTLVKQHKTRSSKMEVYHRDIVHIWKHDLNKGNEENNIS